MGGGNGNSTSGDGGVKRALDPRPSLELRPSLDPRPLEGGGEPAGLEGGREPPVGLEGGREPPAGLEDGRRGASCIARTAAARTAASGWLSSVAMATSAPAVPAAPSRSADGNTAGVPGNGSGAPDPNWRPTAKSMTWLAAAPPSSVETCENSEKAAVEVGRPEA
mmetsp:Transcript_60638/g.123733  ORF Transcript_60638/g.123733 Transcript_60638/m.123733 type:complete len:165 (-) Transcript_60638:159-653(-)